MLIVNLGKELTLRRLYWDYYSGAAVFSGVNAMIFGTAFDPNFSGSATQLNSGVLQVGVAANIVTSPSLGIKFTAAINESAISGDYTLNEVGLAYVSGLQPNQIRETTSTDYTLFSYSAIHNFIVSGGFSNVYNVSITIYYT